MENTAQIIFLSALVTVLIFGLALYILYPIAKDLSYHDPELIEHETGYTDPLENPEVEQALIMRKMYAELEIIIPDWHKITPDDPPHISEATMISRQEAFQAGLNPDRDNIRKLLFFMREGMRAYAKELAESELPRMSEKYPDDFAAGLRKGMMP